MGADQEVDIVRTQIKIGEMLKHIFFILGWRRSWLLRVIRW